MTKIRSLILVALLPCAAAEAAPVVGPLSTYLVEPCRFVDTRDPVTFWYEPEGPALTARLYLLQGSCGVPIGARAAMLNVTVVGATAAGHLSLWDLTPPKTSFLNFMPSRSVAGFVIAPLWEVQAGGDTADFALMPGFATPDQSVHVIIDVVGFLR